jgi:signal transduction histidine kinase
LKSSNWDSLRRDIGGEFVGDPRALLVVVPIAWPLSMLNTDLATEPLAFTALMIGNALAFTFCYLLMLSFQKTIFKNRFQSVIALPTVVIAGLILGASKVGITALVAALISQDFSDFGGLPVRLLAGATTGAWVVPVAAVTLAIQHRYRTAREVAFAEALNQGLQASGDNFSDPAQNRLRAVLAELRDAVNKNSESPTSLAKNLNYLLENKVRPLSRDLWVGPTTKQRDLMVLRLIRLVFLRGNYWPLPTTLVLIATSAAPQFSSVGLFEGSLRLITTFAIALGILFIMQLVRPASEIQGLLVFVLGATIFGVANELVALLVFGPFGGFSTVFYGILNGFLFATLALVLGVLKASLARESDLGFDLTQILGKSYFPNRIEFEQTKKRHRELAGLIHGRLQNQILGMVLALSKNDGSRSPEELLNEIEQVELAISSSNEPPQNRATRNLNDELSALKKRWTGLIEIGLEQGFFDEAKPKESAFILELAEEAVTNAVRHGLASTISLSITKQPGHWLLVAEDNGLGPRKGNPGLGSHTLNQLSGNNWSLTRNQSGVGSKLLVQIPNLENQSLSPKTQYPS